jgi:PAS domain S-box-containing protein
MESNLVTDRTCFNCNETIDKLKARISELEQANTSLRMLDGAMRRNNALFDAFLAKGRQGIALTGPDRRILRVVRGLTGFRTEEMSGTLIESFAVPDDRQMIVEAYQKLLCRTCENITLELRVPRADGTTARFSATLIDMLDDPNLRCIVWNYSDITQETQGECAPAPY